MATKIPTRDPIGIEEASPKQIFEFGEYIGKRLKKAHEKESSAHVSSGLISGGKLAQPTLWSILDMLGLKKDFDEYTLGKFQRGHDVEARAIQFLTNLDYQYILSIITGSIENPGWIALPEDSMLSGEVYLQMPSSYRGSIGYIDLAQRNNDKVILHEVKSSTKMAYDKVAATGASARKKQPDGSYIEQKPEPYYHHCVQLSLYALGEGTDRAFVHYFNADDYRLCSFEINPQEYKAEVDFEIDAIQKAFVNKTLPPFEALLPFHKIKNYQSFGDEWNLLSADELLGKLQKDHPEAFDKFNSTVLPTGE